MEITEIRVWVAREQRGKILANASVTFDGVLVVQGFRILQGDDGPWVGFPSRKNPEGSERAYSNTVFSLDKDFRETIQSKILERYNETGGAFGPEGSGQ